MQYNNTRHTKNKQLEITYVSIAKFQQATKKQIAESYKQNVYLAYLQYYYCEVRSVVNCTEFYLMKKNTYTTKYTLQNTKLYVG